MSTSPLIVIAASRRLSLWLAGLSLTFVLAACAGPAAPPVLPPAAATAAAQAATGEAQVDAWAAATGTALHLTALAPSATAAMPVPPTPVPPTPLPPTVAPTIAASATPLPVPTTQPTLAPADTATEPPLTVPPPADTPVLPSPTSTLDCSVQNCLPPTVEIPSFTVDRTQVTPGDQVTFTWSTRYASHVILERLGLGEHNATVWDNLPLTGTLTLTMDGVVRDQYRYDLWADNASISDYVHGSNAFREAEIYYPCPDPLFMNITLKRTWVDVCGAAPAVYSSAVEQSFQHGLMINLEAQHTIYVFYTYAYLADSEGPNGYDILPDTWTAGDPESDPALTPPAGLLQPVRALGKVWREQPHARDRLGWATSPEKAFAGAYQRDWSTCSGGCGHAGNIYLQTSVPADVIRIDPTVAELWGWLTSSP